METTSKTKAKGREVIVNGERITIYEARQPTSGTISAFYRSDSTRDLDAVYQLNDTPKPLSGNLTNLFKYGERGVLFGPVYTPESRKIGRVIETWKYLSIAWGNFRGFQEQQFRQCLRNGELNSCFDEQDFDAAINSAYLKRVNFENKDIVLPNAFDRFNPETNSLLTIMLNLRRRARGK